MAHSLNPTRVLRVLALVLLAASPLLGPGRAGAEEVRMSVDAARSAAAMALSDGNAKLALMLADGVLLGAPGDVPALLIKSRALRDLGRSGEAAGAAKLAFSTTEDDRERYFAALLTGRARATGGAPGMAQLWLRRAAHIAPEEPLRALAVNDFRKVRSVTPWRLSLNMAMEPSDNLNGAPKTNTFSFGGLSFVNPSAVPLSGKRFVLGGDYLYRLPLDKTRRLNFGVGAEVQRVRFSDEARDKVPGIRDTDYRQDSLLLSLGYEMRDPEGRWLANSKASVARHWLGGMLYSDAARLDLSYGRALVPGWQGGVRLGFEDETRHDAGLRDAQTREIGLSLTRSLAAASVRLDLSVADTASDSRLVARETARAALSFGMGKPVKGMLPRVTLAWEVEDFDQGPSAFWDDPRRDEEMSLSLDVVLPDLDYYGFAPEIGVSFRDRSSNYTVYETRGTDLHLGLKSVF
ncbi:surface lipoprotein assembly modifier [Antarctobacter jejuensis]|uniref:surface lipoprotein assembly modifier n=1 Tax=Antarctobacter jejuensis TaxID=1439938 RepID=UPI003FCFC9E5